MSSNDKSAFIRKYDKVTFLFLPALAALGDYWVPNDQIILNVITVLLLSIVALLIFPVYTVILECPEGEEFTLLGRPLYSL